MMTTITEPSGLIIFLAGQAVYIACSSLIEKIVSEIYKVNKTRFQYEYTRDLAHSLRESIEMQSKIALMYFFTSCLVALIGYIYAYDLILNTPDNDKLFSKTSFNSYLTVFMLITCPIIAISSLHKFWLYIRVRKEELIVPLVKKMKPL